LDDSNGRPEPPLRSIIPTSVHLGPLPGGDVFVPSRTALVEPGTRVRLAGAAQAPANGYGRVSLVRESSRSREYSVSGSLHAGMAASCLCVSGLVWLGVLLGTVRYRAVGAEDARR